MSADPSSDRWPLPLGWDWHTVEHNGSVLWGAFTVGNDASVAPDGTATGFLHAGECAISQLVKDRNASDPPGSK